MSDKLALRKEYLKEQVKIEQERQKKLRAEQLILKEKDEILEKKIMAMRLQGAQNAQVRSDILHRWERSGKLAQLITKKFGSFLNQQGAEDEQLVEGEKINKHVLFNHHLKEVLQAGEWNKIPILLKCVISENVLTNKKRKEVQKEIQSLKLAAENLKSEEYMKPYAEALCSMKDDITSLAAALEIREAKIKEVTNIQKQMYQEVDDEVEID